MMTPKFFKAFPFRFLIGGTLLAISTLFVACEDQKDPADIPTPTEETAERPDPINDLAAYLSTSLGVLMVDPEYLEEVIELLGLSPTTDGQYEKWVTSPEGETFSFLFDLELIPIPELYFAAKPDMELDIRPTRDEDGVWYRVWKNAECGQKVKKGTVGQCIELPAVIPETGAVARQHKIEPADYTYCKKGSGTCLEKLKTVGKTYFYDRLCKDEDTPQGQEVASTDFQQYVCEE